MTSESIHFDPFVVLPEGGGDVTAGRNAEGHPVTLYRHPELGGVWKIELSEGIPPLEKGVADLKHPSISGIISGVTRDGRSFQAEEWCAGGPLRQLLQKAGALPWPLVRWITFQMVDALECAHSVGLAHGNLDLGRVGLSSAWPDTEIKVSGFSGRPVSPSAVGGDIRAMGLAVKSLLTGKAESEGGPGGLPPQVDQEAREFLAFLAKADAGAGMTAIGDKLAGLFLDSLPEADADLPEAPVEDTSPQEFWQQPPPAVDTPVVPVGRSSNARVPKLAAAAAAIALVGTTAFLLISRKGTSQAGDEAANNRSAQQQTDQRKAAEEEARIAEETRKAAEEKRLAVEKAEKERIAREEAAARELAEKERLAREEAARMAAEKERAEKEQAAKELAMKEQAEREKAEKEKMAMEKAAAEKAAAEKAAKEQALLREADASVPKLESILEDEDSPATLKEKSFAQVLEYAKLGHVKAIELCGASYWRGSGVAKDQREASTWFQKGAALGNARSMLGLGNCHEQGIGFEKDVKKAVEWWEKAAALGEGLAMSRLGEYYNSNPAERDVTKAMEWWTKAADQGVPEAMTNLGILYEAGSTGKKDGKKAVELWERAAAEGEPRAMAELGYKYFNGEVSGKSKKDAFQLFQRAVKSGDVRAMTGLGVCYFTGGGTETDKAEGEKWLRKAAELGEPSAKAVMKQLNIR